MSSNSMWISKEFVGGKLKRKKTLKRKKPVTEKYYQKADPIIEIPSPLVFWVKKQIGNLTEKMRGIGLSSVAQWCIILVMLYFTLAG
jgi:hypothetical protein